MQQVIEKSLHIEESNARGLEEIKTGEQYIRTGTHQQCNHECACSDAKIHALEGRLRHSELTVLYLTEQLRVCAILFCEESVRSDDFTRFYTGQTLVL